MESMNKRAGGTTWGGSSWSSGGGGFSGGGGSFGGGGSSQAESLESAPYPSIAAIQNVFALGVKRNPEIKEFNPLALWDLHYVKEVDDSGYIRKFYA